MTKTQEKLIKVLKVMYPAKPVRESYTMDQVMAALAFMDELAEKEVT